MFFFVRISKSGMRKLRTWLKLRLELTAHLAQTSTEKFDSSTAMQELRKHVNFLKSFHGAQLLEVPTTCCSTSRNEPGCSSSIANIAVMMRKILYIICFDVPCMNVLLKCTAFCYPFFCFFLSLNMTSFDPLTSASVEVAFHNHVLLRS